MADTQSKERASNQESTSRPQQSNAGPASPAPDEKPIEEKSGGKKPILYAIGAVVLVLALIFGVRFYLFNRVHVSTDDAYVTGDLVNVSPQINGTLQTLVVKEGDYVKAGQLIATLDPSGPEATLRQAQANYLAAMSQVPVAEQNLQFAKLSTDAAIRKAQSALGAQQSKTMGARQQLGLTTDTVKNQVNEAKASVAAAEAQWAQATAQTASAVASKDNSVQAVQTATDALANYQQQIVTAQHAQRSAESRAAAAAATAQRAAQDAARYRILYSEDAISAQTNDQAQANARNAAASLSAAQSDALQATSQVESARKAAQQAESQVEQARKSVAQATAMVAATSKAADAAHEQVRVSQAALGVALANLNQVGVQESNLDSTAKQTGEAEADVANAQSGSAQVAAKQEAVKTAQAQAAEAKAAVTNAEINLSDTKIYAPSDGEVVRKDSNVGATLSPGSTIVTLTQGDYVWVTANFKETQLADVRIGQPCEVEADAFPGKVFKGYVRDITQATGAATALLPPDNATGNFTKVVQRVPIRIELEAGSGDDKKYANAEDLRNLRQGLSVTATIDTSDTNPQPIPHGKNSSGSGEQGHNGGTPGMDQKGPSTSQDPTAPTGANPNSAGSTPVDSDAPAPPSSNSSTGSPAGSGTGVTPSPAPSMMSNPGTGPSPSHSASGTVSPGSSPSTPSTATPGGAPSAGSTGSGSTGAGSAGSGSAGTGGGSASGGH